MRTLASGWPMGRAKRRRHAYRMGLGPNGLRRQEGRRAVAGWAGVERDAGRGAGGGGAVMPAVEPKTWQFTEVRIVSAQLPDPSDWIKRAKEELQWVIMRRIAQAVPPDGV